MRWKNGRTLKELNKMKRKELVDHTGRHFNSIADACAFWHVAYPTFKDRIKNGMSLEMALQPRPLNAVISADHHGKKYKSIREMCRAYGVAEFTFRDRLNKGWPLKKCLTQGKVYKRDFYDHLGKHYVSLSAMAKAWNIPVGRLNFRLKQKWLIKDALTSPCCRVGKRVSNDDIEREQELIKQAQKAWEKE